MDGWRLPAVDEFQADLISENRKGGLAAAQARGRKGWGKPKLNDRQVAAIRRMHDADEHTVTELAEMSSVTRPTIYPVLGEQLVGQASA